MNEDVRIKTTSQSQKEMNQTLLLVTHEPDNTSSVNVKAVEVRFQFKWSKNDPSGLSKMFYI